MGERIFLISQSLLLRSTSRATRFCSTLHQEPTTQISVVSCLEACHLIQENCIKKVRLSNPRNLSVLDDSTKSESPSFYLQSRRSTKAAVGRDAWQTICLT